MKLVRTILVLCLAWHTLAGSYALPKAEAGQYLVGAGKYDITGPAAEIGMMGYCMIQQTTFGIHLRLRARAFIFVDPTTSNRVVLVNMDACMTMQSMKTVVVEKLQKLYGFTMYTELNVLMTGTHTHAGPGGYSWHPFYNIPTLGFHEDNFNAVVNGVVAAIQQAHDSIQPVYMFMAKGTLDNSNINRSPTAYENNPPADKAKYNANTDKEMTVVKIVGANGKEVGMLDWFAVHGTSMNNENGFISGDNKGYAEYFVERLKNGNATLTGKGKFIAAFVQANAGDVSPNTRGAFCDNGMACEVAHSTCGDFSENCHGYGPGKDEFDSCRIIGSNQAQAALKLYNSAATPITGPVGHVFQYVDMENVQVAPQYSGLSSNVSTCIAGLGDAFAAGTTDGPGEFNFVQGTNQSSTNAYWNWLASHILAGPTEEQSKCHSPKPILLYIGGIKWPAEWAQGILPLQIIRIGQIFVVGVPGEPTTMSGRKMREQIENVLAANGVKNATVLVTGLTNAYSHYIATPAEYHIQRYEGASTLFGPYTLPAYLQEYSKLAAIIAKSQPNPPIDIRPPDIRNSVFDFQPGVIVDEGNFGAVREQPKPQYRRGETVKAVFVSANPRNNLLIEQTFLTVERQDQNGLWNVVYNDGDWATKYRWTREGIAGSLATITWDIDPMETPGTYRIRHFGNYKTFAGSIHPFSGTSQSFTVSSQ